VLLGLPPFGLRQLILCGGLAITHRDGRPLIALPLLDEGKRARTTSVVPYA
jgi:hypothetical protein